MESLADVGPEQIARAGRGDEVVGEQLGVVDGELADVAVVEGAAVEDEDELVVSGVVRGRPGDEQQLADRHGEVEFLA